MSCSQDSGSEFPRPLPDKNICHAPSRSLRDRGIEFTGFRSFGKHELPYALKSKVKGPTSLLRDFEEPRCFRFLGVWPEGGGVGNPSRNSAIGKQRLHVNKS